jgi:hypothetical protein
VTACCGSRGGDAAGGCGGISKGGNQRDDLEDHHDDVVVDTIKLERLWAEEKDLDAVEK